MSQPDEFVKVFQVPPAMVPYVHLVATRQEMELVVALAGQALTLEEVAETLRISREEAAALLRGAFHRDLVNRDTRAGMTTYSPGKFYTTLDYFSSVETSTWKRLPLAARQAVGEWQVQAFIELWKPAIDRVVANPDAWLPIKNRDVLLLDEALALVEATEEGRRLVARLVEERRAGAESLFAQSKQLQDTIEFFKIDDGRKSGRASVLRTAARPGKKPASGVQAKAVAAKEDDVEYDDYEKF